MNYSKQRELILRTVTASTTHPTADEIYMYVKKELPNISLGTVYRNLKVLAETGQIIRVSFPTSNDRYEGMKPGHHHGQCLHCHTIFDFELPELYAFDAKIAEETGLLIEERTYVVDGICKSCAEKVQ